MTGELVAGQLTTLAAGIRRLIAPNPGMMTGPGTNTYLLGNEEIAVIDPGPQIESHLQLLAAAGDIRWILVSHTHPDHSPGAAMLAEMTGASLIGLPAPDGPHQDTSFCPDEIPADGELLNRPGFAIQVIHTPGHASNHLCFLHKEHRWLFTGDHIMNGSTVVIDPPDGNMKHYLQSLERVKSLAPIALLPGHGEKIDKPDVAIDWIIEHRLEREQKVVAALKANPETTTRDLVPHVYTDVPEKLYAWAERSLLAHLIKLEDDGIATLAADQWTAR